MIWSDDMKNKRDNANLSENPKYTVFENIYFHEFRVPPLERTEIKINTLYLNSGPLLKRDSLIHTPLVLYIT